jgi:methyl-accepting chemotaxis protein
MFSVAYKARNEKRSVVRHQNIIDITVEVKLLQEIKDILDELMIMTTLLREQLSVSKTFARHVETLRTGSAPGADHYRVPNSRTISRADDLLKSIEERIAELQRLVSTATDVSSAVSNLASIGN